LTRLVGEAEEKQLQIIAGASVGVVVGGRRNRYATAFPLGDPGLLVTNARVLIGADQSSLRVRTAANREFPASVVGYDLPSGVGLLRAEIPATQRPEASTASLSPPEPSWAVCFPIAREDDTVRYLPVSLHKGRVTAAQQSGTFLVSFENLLRTDHAIEEGCTGGPLVDSRGKVAGMILGGPDDGITFALPLEEVSPIVDTLSRNERPARPFYGIGLVPPDDRRRAKFSIDPRVTHPIVPFLIPGSPAEQAGVQPGDALLRIGADAIATVREAGARLLAAAPGGAGVTLTLSRGGSDRQVTVRPVKRPERVLLRPIDEIQETLEANLKEIASGPGAQQGLLVADLVRGGRGEKRWFRNGDIILSVYGKSVKRPEAFDEVIRAKFKAVFSDGQVKDRQYSSSYLLLLEVRTAEGEKVTREYFNLFPDVLAPPVY
jgi:S1-C subfamily serine protease